MRVRYRGLCEDGEAVAIKAISAGFRVCDCLSVSPRVVQVIPTWRLVLEPGCEDGFGSGTCFSFSFRLVNHAWARLPL